MSSPYPWHYTLRWPFYYWWPSTKNHSRIGTRPSAHHFINESTAKYQRLLFCGDIMITQHDVIPTLHPKLCALLNSADLFIGNCEAPVGNQIINPNARYRMRFDMPRDFLIGIMNQLTLSPKQWALSVANNHSGDQGEEKFRATGRLLKALGVTPIGELNETGSPITVIEHNPLRIGIAAWTEWMNCEIFADNLGVNRLAQMLDNKIQQLKSELKLDLLIGLPHWEYEFQHFPRKETRTHAKKLIDDYGFNLLVGSHPHTLMPMEWFSQGICQYSLGNFCGLGSAWPVKLIPILEVQVGTENPHQGSLLSYFTHYFVQIPNYTDPQHRKINIMPLAAAPLPIQQKIKKRLSLLVNQGTH